MADVVGVTRPRARIRHHCCWCRSPIRPGEVYERWMAKDAADVWTLKAHPECVEAMQEIHRRNQLFSDEGACWRDDHETGRGCEECDPSGTVGLP